VTPEAPVPEPTAKTQPSTERTTRTEPSATPRENRGRDPLAHAYCALCVPRPRIGQTITALCGTDKVYDGSPPGKEECVVCAHLLAANPLDCGHPSPTAADS
jgi:hypothetical protein